MTDYNKRISISDGIEYIKTDDCSGFIVEHRAMNSDTLIKLKAFTGIHYPPIYDLKADKFYFLDYDKLDVKTNMVAVHFTKSQASKLLGQVLTDTAYQDWKDQCFMELKNHDPDYFTHVTGRELSIFDSLSLMSDFVLSSCEVSRFIITAVQPSDNAKNYAVVSGYTSNHPDEDHELSFLTPVENIEAYTNFKGRNIPLCNW